MRNLTGNFMIAQGGGPTAVINASLTGAVFESLGSLSASAKLWGARGGISGFLNERFIDLRRPSVETWNDVRDSPGCALGSSRRKMGEADFARTIELCRKNDIRYFFYIGGNGSMDTVYRISQATEQEGYELYVAGIPKTIDNDIPGTDFCPGYGSCARFIAQSCMDLGMDIGSLPTPVSIMEVIGRNAGWTAAAAMLARNKQDQAPHLVYVPEIPLSRDRFLNDIQTVYDREGWVVAVVSEGVCDESGDSLGISADKNQWDEYGSQIPGDVAPALAQLVTKKLGIRARSEKPGLLARASSHHVSNVDRDEAEAVGRFAVRHAMSGNTGFMSALKRESSSPLEFSYWSVPLEIAVEGERLLPREYINEDHNGIQVSFRDYVEPLIGGPLRRYAHLDEFK